MAGTRVELIGAREAQRYLKLLADGSKAAGNKVVLVGTNLVYGYGIETGRHRGGGLARRAGGVFYLSGALAQVRPRIRKALTAALPGGPGAVLAAAKRLGFDVERIAKERVVVRTGTLRRSLHTTVGPR